MPSIPVPQDKWKLAELGVKHVKKFLAANNLPTPHLELLGPSDRRYHVNSCGFYRGDPQPRVVVMPMKCAGLGTAGRQWSWPGHMVDRTPFGVVAHEIGHYIHDTVIGWRTNLQGSVGEKPLTGYCGHHTEWLAEMVRLFITNPDLLKRVRPKAYTALCGYVISVEKRPWYKVLHSAPDRTIELLKRRIHEQQQRTEVQMGQVVQTEEH